MNSPAFEENGTLFYKVFFFIKKTKGGYIKKIFKTDLILSLKKEKNIIKKGWCRK